MCAIHLDVILTTKISLYLHQVCPFPTQSSELTSSDSLPLLRAISLPKHTVRSTPSRARIGCSTRTGTVRTTLPSRTGARTKGASTAHPKGSRVLRIQETALVLRISQSDTMTRRVEVTATLSIRSGLSRVCMLISQSLVRQIFQLIGQRRRRYHSQARWHL